MFRNNQECKIPKSVNMARHVQALLLCVFLLLALPACMDREAGVPEDTTARPAATATATLPTPSPTPTPTPMPTPTPTPVPPPPFLPGQPKISPDSLNPRILSLAADPSAWSPTDAAGWINRGDGFLITPDAAGENAWITEGITIGSPMDAAIETIGYPVHRQTGCKVYYFDGFVLVLFGEDSIEAAAFLGVVTPGTNQYVANALCSNLYEYNHLYIRADGKMLSSQDNKSMLAYFEGEEPFFAVYPKSDKKRWIVLYGASREYYWVNAHTFLSMDADTLAPSCHSFDFSATDPAMRIRSFPLVDIQQVDTEIRIDMKYASEDNFVKTNLYGDLMTVYMPPEAAERLARAHAALQAEYPYLRLLVYDAYRPKSAQKRMWDIVQGTAYQAILSNPDNWFSNHYIGMAVDLTLFDTRSGQELDMGTPFDSFDKLAWPQHEAEFLASGRLTVEQYNHRLILRKVMEQQDFAQLYFEWWQFDLYLGGIPNMYRWFE